MVAQGLVLDEHTLIDLDVFESGTEGTSLFEFCNLTRSHGGSRALRRRMTRPWSDAGDIRATQDAIRFIQTHRELFRQLPSGHAMNRVARYQQEILPIVTQEGAFEFWLGALSLWASHDSHYSSIVRGVQMTCALVRAMRQFMEHAIAEAPAGELVVLIDEMRDLLALKRIEQVPDDGAGSWPWRILRLDQVFRQSERTAVSRLLEIAYELDALTAMADVTRRHGFVLPEIESGPLRVHAEGLIHPFVEHAVPNPVALDQRSRVLFLTGPNMAGKTTYLRAFATAFYFAHVGMGVPARRFNFVPADCLFSSVSLTDDLQSGVSYFQAEALRVKAIAEALVAGHRVVALLDEPFKGTNVKDAFDASLAILQRFATMDDCLFLFSSHLIELSERLQDAGGIKCSFFEAKEGEGRLQFDYALHPGVSAQRLGMRVLEEAGIFQLLDRAATDHGNGTS